MCHSEKYHYEYSLLIEIQGKSLKVIDANGRVAEKFPVICGSKIPMRVINCRKVTSGLQVGLYYICTINEKSQFTVFYGISYPGSEDALRGLQEG